MHSVTAGRPSAVPGILIIALGRSTARQSRFGSTIVAAVSRARAGETSMDTRPSWPQAPWATGATGSVVHRKKEAARGPNLGCLDLFENLGRGPAFTGQSPDVLVVELT